MKRTSLALLFALASGTALSASAADLKSAVEKTIINNPEVRFRWHEFRAAAEEQGLGRAGYLPTLDVGYGWGKEKTTQAATQSGGPEVTQDLTRKGWSANLTQNLFQGLQTMNLVKQLDYTQRAKYFDFLGASEGQALEAARAYVDVLRYRQLLEFAQDNYATHLSIYKQLQEKVSAGVGRRVDLEQAGGRLALAESNLVTELSNLHDVAARYARLTGEEPQLAMAEPMVLKGYLPKDQELIAGAVKTSPAYLAALENVRAAKADVNVRKGAFSPTLDLRASKAHGDNLDGSFNRKDRQMAELVFNINLFRGGADRARLGASAERLNAAYDLRDKECRDLRQTLRIAFNDTRKLEEQIAYLRQHRLSTEKARDAYRAQFDIGQRTLLDLLDSENELYDAKRSVVNAEQDVLLAQARVLAGSGKLLETLQLKPIESYDFAGPARDEEVAVCDTQYVGSAVFDKSGIAPKPVAVPAALPKAAAAAFVLKGDVAFAANQSQLSAQGKAELARIARQLKTAGQPESVISVTGYTDRLGTDAYNLKLSKARAVAVADYLVSQGVPANRLQTEGLGKADPVTGSKCNQIKSQPALGQCLAPDRRVVIRFK
ncbi:TolC family outer membrane protein [Craterilacuibacter sinensis]|uniref:TolC family outer membrane protein n=1 Tax=Craterilacuibacter sinensis TaxID=2686017 RepID=UPI00136F9A6E|nr:TolC family outer membrane protein [Craterilacuibacter sinensis]